MGLELLHYSVVYDITCAKVMTLILLREQRGHAQMTSVPGRGEVVSQNLTAVREVGAPHVLGVSAGWTFCPF